MNRDEIESLIPFFVNGTLDDKETATVRAALANDPELTKIVDAEMVLVGRIGEEPTAVEPIVAERERAYGALAAKLNGKPSNGYPSLKPLALAASVMIVVAVGSFWAGRATTPTFETMSLPSTANTVQLMFHPSATERDVRLILVDSGANLLASPSARGVYRIGLPNTVDAEQFVIRMRQHPAIRWAEVEL